MDRNNLPVDNDDQDDQFDPAELAEDNDKQATGITEPRDTDVLCGRGGAALRHPGNQTYRKLVNLNKGLYITCLKTEKLKISRSIVAAIREQNGRFLEKESNSDSDTKGTWYDIGDKKAIEKTSQALREGQPKLRQKIAELGGAAVGGADINPHCLPYAATAANIQQQILMPPPPPASFHGSLHSMGSASFSLGESGILSAASYNSIPYSHQAEIVAVRNNISLNGGMPPPITPQFLQQGMNDGGMMSHGLYQQEQQEFQVQRMQSMENPHHRDIPLNNIVPNGQSQQGTDLLLQADLLQRLSLHDMSITSSSVGPNNGNIISGGFQLQPSNSAVSGFGMSIRTVDSSAINTVDTFNSLNNNSTSGGGGNMSNKYTNFDNPQQRMALAKELGIEESQLSFLTDFSPQVDNCNGMMNGSIMDNMSVDSFKRAINNLPNSGHSTNHGIHSNNNGQINNGSNPQITHINLDINSSMTSCMTNHSAFNINGGSSMHNIPTNSHRTQGSTSYQQYVQNQQQNQQQQQLQRRQQLLLQQRQQQLQLQQQRAQQNSRQNDRLQNNNDGDDLNNMNSGYSNSNNGEMNKLDRRQVFATMKFVRPPSVREQPQVTSVPVSQSGAIRHQQQQRPLPHQPEVTRIKVSDGINGTRNNKNLEDIPDYSMGDSNHSTCSNFTMTTVKDEEKDDGITHPGQPKAGSGGGSLPKKNEVVVETAKVRDHSSKEEQMRKEEFMNGNNGSKRSIMSGLSEVSIFSDLSRKIGNVSTRSMAMSEMSSVDQLDMEEHLDENDDDNNHDVNDLNADKEHSYGADDNHYHPGAISDPPRGHRALVTGIDGREFHI